MVCEIRASGFGGADCAGEIDQALFKLVAAHLVAIHEQTHGFSDERLRAIHAPGDQGLVPFRHVSMPSYFAKAEKHDGSQESGTGYHKININLKKSQIMTHDSSG